MTDLDDKTIIVQIGEWIIVCGTPADGFTHYGPFFDSEAACEWAERVLRNLDWWCVRIFKEVQ